MLLSGTHEKVLYRKAFGDTDYISQQPVESETVYDLASLTKPLATTLAVLALVQDQKVSLNTCLGDLLPEFRGSPKAAIEFRHLLYHTSGLPAHRHYYRKLQHLPMADRKPALRRLLLAEPLVRPIGEKSEYSDLGFMLLCWCVEALSRTRLDRYVMARIYHPLHLRDLFFVDLEGAPVQANFAPAEACPWRNTLIRGAVSDDNAWVTGGIDGHAGLFGTVGDVYHLLKALLLSFLGQPNDVGFSASLMAEFFARDAQSGRALGFDMPSKNSSSGRYFSKNTVGHLGFTGTSFWMDLDRCVIVVLLTNRVHPDRGNYLIRKFRPILHDAVMGAFWGKGV